MTGIAGYGVYVPYWRLDRARIASSLGLAPKAGTRAVASYDEDATTMAVEACRTTLRTAPPGPAPAYLLFATTDPTYADKTNATAIHAALDLPQRVGAYDIVGSVRGGVGALRLALETKKPMLVAVSDLRSGRAGSMDEERGGDAAAAVLTVPDGPNVAEYLGSGSTSEELLSRWRVPGDTYSHLWEERFGQEPYVEAGCVALSEALDSAALKIDSIDRFIVSGVHLRGVRALRHWITDHGGSVAEDNLVDIIGDTGTANAVMQLAAVLDHARPRETVALIQLADGADALIFRVCEGNRRFRGSRARTVEAEIARGTAEVPYISFLVWRRRLEREPPRRPDPEPPAGPPSYRHSGWKFGFVGSRCSQCGTLHLPPARVCIKCHASDTMTRERSADLSGTVATFTVDRLTYSLAPPVVAAVVDFDGGGRIRCELTDVDADHVAIGDRVEMTFRCVGTGGNGVHNYFWKARPVRDD